MTMYIVLSVDSSEVIHPSPDAFMFVLTQKVNSHLAAGWKCQGGVAIVSHEGVMYFVSQAMTLF
jgi:hypothetical protein